MNHVLDIFDSRYGAARPNHMTVFSKLTFEILAGAKKKNWNDKDCT
jgi:hypothetical protein